MFYKDYLPIHLSLFISTDSQVHTDTSKPRYARLSLTIALMGDGYEYELLATFIGQ